MLDSDTISEDGGVATVTASLSATSTAETTVMVSVDPTITSSLSSNTVLTIAAGQTASSGVVTIAAVNDSVYTGDREVTVSGSAVNSVGVDGPGDVMLTIIDDESEPVVRPRLVISPSAVTVGEGAEEVYFVSLASFPTGSVTVAISISPGDAAVDASVLTFTMLDWDVAQPVAVTAYHDEDDTEDPSQTVTHTAMGGGYDNITVGLVVTIIEDDGGESPSSDVEGVEESVTRFVNVVVGDSFACGVFGADGDGVLSCWGNIGLAPFAADGFVGVYAGRDYVCGLEGDGGSQCWGGVGRRVAPPVVRNAEDDSGDWEFSVVDSSADHVCGIRKVSGFLECWGDDAYGKVSGQPGEVLVGAGLAVAFDYSNLRFADVAVGRDHTCGVLEGGSWDGRMRCWGGSFPGLEAAVVPVRYSFSVFRAVAAGDGFTCGVIGQEGREQGRVLCWGSDVTGVVSGAPDRGGFLSVDAGPFSVCGLRLDGTVVCWGGEDGRDADGVVTLKADFGQADVPLGLQSATFGEVSVGRYHTCGVLDGGTFYRPRFDKWVCWGAVFDDEDSSVRSHGRGLVSPVDYDGVSQHSVGGVEAGLFHNCGLGVDGGEVVCWGNEYLAPPLVEGPFRAVAVGTYHSCALREEGHVTCWGADTSQQVSGWSDNPGEGPAVRFRLVEDVTTAYTFKAITAGHSHSCGVLDGESPGQAEGEVLCWGGNSYGQADPARQTGEGSGRAATFSVVSAGWHHSCGLLDGQGTQVRGRVVCWGGQNTPAARGETESRHSYQRIDFGQAQVPTDLTEVPFGWISAGRYHTCGVRADTGRVACWGHSEMASVPPALREERFTRVSVSSYISCGITAASRVKCWGPGGLNVPGSHPQEPVPRWDVGQFPVPTAYATVNFVAVDAGPRHVCATTPRGKVACWGADANPGTDTMEIFHGPTVVNTRQDQVPAAFRATPRSGPPTLAEATAVGDRLLLTYDKDLDSGWQPAGSDFSVTVVDSVTSETSRPIVTDVAVGGNVVKLALNTRVRHMDTVTLTYQPGNKSIRDNLTRRSASLTNLRVANNTPRSTDTTLRTLAMSGLTLFPSLANGQQNYFDGYEGYFSGHNTYFANCPDDMEMTTVTALAADPRAKVLITPADRDPTTNGDQIMLTGNGSTPVTVAVIPEDRTAAREMYTIHLGANQPGPPEIKIDPGSIAIEEGKRGSYTISPSRQPSADLTIGITVSNHRAASLTTDLSQVTFTPHDWAPRTVTIITSRDPDAVSNPTTTITHTITGPPEYTTPTVEDITVTVEETQTPRIIVTPTALQIDEGQTSDYTVTLASQPSTTTTIHISTPPTADISTSTNSLVFTTGDWNVPRTVTVTAAHDADAATDPTTTITHTASGASEYTPLAVQNVTVNVHEDDTPRIISPTTFTIKEGQTARYWIRLATQPTADVTVEINIPPGSDITDHTTSLTFTPADWDTYQPVTITAAHDDDTMPDPTTTIECTIKGANEYSLLTVEDITLHITEDDPPDIIITRSDLTVNEGQSARYTVKLATRPRTDITININIPTPSDITAHTTSLTFTTNNWNTPQTVSVLAAHDDDAATDPPTTIVHTATGLNPNIVMVNIAEDDTQAIIIAPYTLTLDEGQTARYTVKLATRPSADITITINIPTPSDITANTTNLTFTTNNWNTPQTVTLGTTEDPDSSPDTMVAITHLATTGNHHTKPATLYINIIEDDTPTPH